MKHLLVEGPGKWRRSNGEVVQISDMLYPHLTNALRIVSDRLEKARHHATLARQRHAESDKTTAWAMTEEEAAETFAEFDRIIAMLTAKHTELQDEIRRRPSPLTT